MARRVEPLSIGIFPQIIHRKVVVLVSSQLKQSDNASSFPQNILQGKLSGSYLEKRHCLTYC